MIFLCPIGTIIKKLYICDGIIWKNYIRIHNRSKWICDSYYGAENIIIRVFNMQTI